MIDFFLLSLQVLGTKYQSRLFEIIDPWQGFIHFTLLE